METVSPATVKRELNIVRHCLRIAKLEWGLPIRRNPLDALTIKFADRRRERRLQEGEIERIIDAAKVCRNPYIIPIIQFAIESGMRRGELLSMKWHDLDVSSKALRIPHTKNGHSRCIPLSDRALAVLEPLQDSTEGVFPITANAFRLAWQRTLTRAGIVDLRFHDLRHEAISRFFEMGMSIPEVATISGHRDTSMLLRYAHGDADRVRQKLNGSHASL